MISKQAIVAFQKLSGCIAWSNKAAEWVGVDDLPTPHGLSISKFQTNVFAQLWIDMWVFPAKRMLNKE